MNCLDSLVLDMLEHRGSFRCCAWCVSGDLTMRCSERVRTRNIPCDTSAHFQGTNVIPSVLFSSFKNRPVGSLEAGTPDRMHARKIMSFNILCLLVRPALLLHDNPWMPKASTIAPQGQPCGAHKFTPSLKPIATRTASSSSLKPQEETGMAFNQSPLCGACAARLLLLLLLLLLSSLYRWNSSGDTYNL